ncbi:MAG TPA: phosphoglucosamine mutase [Acidimicrobiales bacterium]|nr:phosphoglucosamine mutase [Acidimicrobiales bacterium]
MTLRFGTDGIRGLANAELTPELVLALGRAATRVLGQEFVVGRDPRVSGPMLQAALSAGMSAEGAAVVDLGVLPTPAVAFVAQDRGVAGAMVSASHNPFHDNGIKLFGPGGTKLDDATQLAMETELDAVLRADPPTSGEVGVMSADHGATRLYVEHLVGSLEERRLDGMRVILDCANGAASALAQDVLRRVGAEVAVLFDRPDGRNINDGCGSNHPEALQEAVRDEGADAGLAFDGDADRVVAVDDTGAVVDGDRVLAMLGPDLDERGLLAERTVVVTVMANLGLRQALARRGIAVVETPVGDRHLLEAMDAGGFALGGEQSGHIILGRLATTGDGILTGLTLLDLLRRAGGPLSDLATGAMERMPQVLRNVRVTDLSRLATADEVWHAVRAAEAELGEEGRVLLRPSGTEPLVRVMVEAATETQAADVVDRLCAVVEQSLGARPSLDA